MSRHTNKEKRRERWYDRWNTWRDSEPPRWRLFSWLSWFFAEPKKPEWLVEYEEWRKKQRWVRNQYWW